jgi:DNA uptake protein ComE-like DNA-binding protein
VRKLLVPLVALALALGLQAAAGAAPVSAAPKGKPAARMSGSGKMSPPRKAEKLGSAMVNINTASEKDLRRVPGIGQTRAHKIVQARPFSNVDDLVTKHILTARELRKIRKNLSTR